MPAKVKVRILAGRNLPVMDKSSDASDAFVEVKLANTTYKTEVYRRSLNPFWNSEWFRFEVSDQELQDEPLQIRIMDYDTYSANDAIGKVYINLNPLLVNPGRSMSGWLPIYDTLHGIRGEINCMVKVNLFADNNRYRHSSCGVRFFFSDIPNGYKCDAILGFVDELLVNDDPEYQWIDKIRTPRASNEARQTLFTKLSGEVQRKLGLKAEIFGGNAVIGYQLSFDLEGGSGIVGRGIGTAVVLSKIGFPYEGIISSLYTNNERTPYPYYAKNSQLGDPKYDRSASRMLFKNPDKHLVHSVSADYFYEVPSIGPSKSLYPALESSNFLKTLTLRQDISRDDSEEEDGDDDDKDDKSDSNYEDCDEVFTNNTEHSGSHRDKTSSRHSTPSNYSYLLKPNRLTSLNKSLNPTRGPSNIKESRKRETNERKLSSSSLLSRLQPLRHEIINRKISILTKPITNQIRLTKLFPFRKRTIHTNVGTSHGHHHHKTPRATPSPTISNSNTETTCQSTNQQQQSDKNEQLALAKSISEDSSGAVLSQQLSVASSSTSSPFMLSGQSSLSTCQSVSLVDSTTATKRRIENRSQSASLDDTLSIIEEKLDDEDHHNFNLRPPGQINESQVRQRVSSASSSKFRPMIRSKEMDLSDDQDGESLQLAMNSSVEAEGENREESNTKFSTTIPPKPTSEVRPIIPTSSTRPDSPSALSSSSPSNSLTTDETIKHGVSSSNRPRFTAQLSTPVEQNVHPVMRRSDTDLAPGVQVISSDLARSESSYTNTLSPHQVVAAQQQRNELGKQRASSISQLQQHQQQRPQLGGFLQSVSAVKAQQHLLQNMIRHQNQNLLLSSDSKAKAAFMYPNRVYQSEYPFVTLKRYPDDMIQCTGGVVSVHSVKLLDHIINDEESETRDIWWTEIRKEIRSHAKALNCNTILGYCETSKVLGDVCILSASGTAAIMNSADSGQNFQRDRLFSTQEQHTNASLAPLQTLKVPPQSHSPLPPAATSMPSAKPRHHQQHHEAPSKSQSTEDEHWRDGGLASGSKLSAGSAGVADKIDCSFCHTPLLCADSISSLASCTVCDAAKVPNVILLTIEPPRKLNIVSSGTLVQARVCRAKRDSHGEASAKEIGDALPFLEFELHRQLFTKLRFKGMNCLFNLSIDISVGENMLTGIATGTGCFVLGLPAPDPPQISAGKGIKASRLNEIQRLISVSARKNRESLGLQHIDSQLASYRERLVTRSYNNDLNNLAGPQTSTVTASFDNQKATNVFTGNGSSNDASAGTSPTEFNQAVSDVHSNDERPAIKSRAQPNLNSQNFLNYHQQANKRHSQQYHHRRHRHNHHHHHHHHRHHYQHHHLHQNHNQQRMMDQDQENSVGGVATSTTNQPADGLLDLLNDDNNIVLEVDDNEDAEIITQLIDSDIPDGYLICSSESIPTLNQSSITSINMFTQVMRVKLMGLDQFAQQFDWILQALFVKLRRSLPCCLSNVSFVIDLPEAHVVQISVTGCLLGLRSSPEQLLTEALGQPNNVADQQSALHGEPVSSRSLTSLISSKSSSSSTSSSSSSSTSSASPSSSPSTGKSTEQSSKSSTSTSIQSVREVNVAQQDQAIASKAIDQSAAARNSDANGKGSDLKSLTKQLSKTNLAALFSGNFDRLKDAAQVGRSSKSATASAANTSKATADLEVTEVELSSKTTRNAMMAVKQEMQRTQLTLTQQPFHTVRAVFKKQQTYPGAYSPQITGHDRLLLAHNSGVPVPVVGVAGGSGSSSGGGTSAGRRATIILNKVKQPLKGFGSSFNATLSLGHTNHSDHPTSGGSVAATTNITSSTSTLINNASSRPTMEAGKSNSNRASPTLKSARSTRGAFAQTSSAGPETSSISFASQDHQQQEAATASASLQISSARAAINSSIDITSLSYIPGAKEYHYLGNLSFSFVRETNSVRENGGLNGFIHCFLMEVYAIVRAHVSALGGNAFLSFRLQQSCILYHSNKNQAQCLISVAGDATQVSM